MFKLHYFCIISKQSNFSKMKNLLLLIVALFVVQVVNAQDETASKKEVKMIMIKKTVDEDGNETIEKIVKEGKEAEEFIFVDEDGEEKDIRVIIKENEEVEIDEEIEIEIKEEIKVKKGRKSVDVDVEETNGQKTIKIVEADGEEVDVKVISLEDGQAIPADIQKKLQELGIDLDEMRKASGDKKVKKKVRVITKEKKAY